MEEILYLGAIAFFGKVIYNSIRYDRKLKNELTELNKEFTSNLNGDVEPEENNLEKTADIPREPEVNPWEIDIPKID
jgi:hypothetical protein